MRSYYFVILSGHVCKSILSSIVKIYICIIYMKYPKDDNGYYVIDGQKYKELVGTRAKVWHGTAYKTSGGLLKQDLVKNKHGDIVSKVKHEQESELSNLLKHGYGHRTDGKFGYEKVKPITERSKSKKTTKSKTKKSKKTTDEVPNQQGGYNGYGTGFASNAALVGGKRRTAHHRRHKHSVGGGSDPFDPDALVGGRRKKHIRSTRRSGGGYSGTPGLFL
jgi:hypothetical protein